MRQAGQLASENDARRFVAWLTTLEIDATAEEDKSGWSIWVRDEDKLPAARAALAEFTADPSNPRYADAEQKANAILRQREARLEQVRRNQVQMRDKWGPAGGAATRRCPLTFALIGLAIVVGLLTNLGRNTGGATFQLLQFSNVSQALQSLRSGPLPESIRGETDAEVEASVQQYVTWYSLRRGQVWRIFTPALLHYGVMHLLFNSMIIYSFGAQIETRYGTPRFLLLVLALAALSNLGQAITSGPGFGGLSGVGYGLFGFLWMKSRYDPASGLRLDQFTVFILMLWFFLCIGTEVESLRPHLEGLMGGRSVANAAHTVGLVVGMAIGIPWQKFLSGRRP